jgi:RimJ/RimL family protein N-acetyltransferase
MKLILETERLLLREFTIDDSEFILTLVNSPDWIKFIGHFDIKTNEQAKDYLLNGPLKSYEVNGFGLSNVILKDKNLSIGMCGIIKRAHLDYPDIGFAFLPAFTGKGFGFEIASATMQYAQEYLKLKKILAITVPGNTASIKLLEKIGMTFSNRFYFPGKDEELLLYKNYK